MNTYNEYDNPAFSRIDARDRLGPKISQNTPKIKITNYKDKFEHFETKETSGRVCGGLRNTLNFAKSPTERLAKENLKYTLCI